MSALLTLFTSAAPAAFSPADLFANGQNGFVLSGFPGGSDFYETDAKVTPATASGSDPIGAITDVSGVGIDAIQAASEKRTTYYIDGNGIRGWLGGDVRSMYPETDIFVTAAMAYVCVYKYVTQAADGSPLISTYLGGWGSGGYFVIACRANTPDDNIQAMCDTDPNDPPAQTIDGALQASEVAAIVRWNRTGTGTDQSVFTTYETDGTQIATSTGTQNATPVNAISLGYNGLATGGTVLKCFELVRDEPLSGAEWASLSAYLTTKLAGGW